MHETLHILDVLQAGRKKQYQREQQSHAQTRTVQPEQPSHRLVDKEHRAAQQLTPAEEYDMKLVCALMVITPILH